MTTPEDIDPLLDAQAAAIAALAQIAFETLLVLIAASTGPAKAVQQVLGTFNGAFMSQMQEAMSSIMGAAVPPAAIAALPVSGLPLSARLYQQVQQTSMEVDSLVKAHAAGMHSARDLAMRLYDGYNPKDGIIRPIEGRSMATLPKPLRELMQLDPKLKGSYEALLTQVQQAASILKTGALKAAYTEVIDQWAKDKGKESLQRKLDVAFKEKTRFHANRIAQTELARAHQDKVGTEFMLDSSISVVQVVMSPGHPLTDICDYHAKVNLFNLGPGCYPKGKAPKPIYHPFCRCVIRSRPDLTDAAAREVQGGEAAYLRTLPTGQAARIVGSRDKLQQVLGGKPLDDILNTGKDPAYHLTRLGQLDLTKVHPARVPLGTENKSDPYAQVHGNQIYAQAAPKAPDTFAANQISIDNSTVNEARIKKSIGQQAWDAAALELSSRSMPPKVASAGLTMAEQVALYTWTLDTTKGPWFTRINRVLRMGNTDSAEFESVWPLATAIKSALDKLPPYVGVTYRAIKQAGFKSDEWSAFMAQFVVGDSVLLQGFSGCTTNAEQMLRGRVRMTVVSATGRDISAFSSKKEQNEILLNHGTMIEIDQNESTKNGAIRIWAREI